MRILGSKGGDSGGSPSESPDSLHSIAYARVLDLISEGPIFGLVNGLQSVYLDDTPILNGDGSSNFSSYSVDYRLGTQDQTYLSGFPAVENENAVSVPLTSDTPWVHQVENTQLTAVRIRFGVPALQKSDSTTGNVTGYRIEYAIDLATDGGSYSQVVTGAFDGKTTTLYERSVRIELPAAATGWLVRVRRITANAHSSLIADAVNIEAITEIIDRKLRYPMSALVGLSFDAQSFSSVPTRAYDIKGLLIRIPSNYDPEARTYSGTWDGTFKTAWSNNPAWIFYDLVLNTRYGLGARIDASMVDKWGLYDIGRYCDVMVSDGKGGQEPRFTCNAVIQSQADAYKVLQDLATTFRGIAYWGPGAVVASADMPSDPVYVYTAANVVGGKFQYVGSERKTRYTTALISWNDPANAFKQAVEPVQDDDGIARYGVVKAQITAFGTTSQGQAHRLGLWTLLTSRYETNTVSFQIGLDGTMCAPGQIIAVADPVKAGKRMGGRMRAVAGRSITLDKAPTVSAGDTLTVILPTGVAEKQTVSGVAGDTVTVSGDFSVTPVPGAVWMLESADLASQLFRVVSLQESDDDGQITYTVNATQYEPGKYAAIDYGAAIQVRPITVVPPSVQPPPTGVTVSTYSVIDQGISKTVMVIAWNAADKAVSYLPEWRKDNGEWVPMNAVGGLQAEVVGIYQGTYLARVRAVNAMGVTSIPAYGVDTALTGKTSPPPALTSLTTITQVFAIEVDWTFPADGSAGDTQYTDVWYSKTNDRSTATRLSIYPYPQSRASLMGLAAAQSFFFWARLVDTSGNIGPWYPTGAGVNGQSSSDATPILEMLTGQITESQLGQDLLTPIQAIPGIQHDVSTTAAAVTQETQDRITAIQNEAAARGAAITSEQNARQAADTSLGQRIDTVTASVNSNASAIQTEQTARADGDSANATAITALTSTVGTKTTTFRQSITPIAQAVGDTWVDTGSTNLLTYSQAFDNAAWTKSNYAVTPAAIAAPDGTLTGQKLADTSATTGTHGLFQNVAAANATLTNALTVYAQASERATLTLRLISRSNTGNYLAGIFHLDTGACSASNVGGATGAAVTMTAAGGGWYRCTVSGVADATGTTGLQAYIFAPLAGGSSSYAGTVGAGIYVWGAQLEQNTGPGRYIPTTSASVSTVGNNSLWVWDGSTWQLSQDAAIPANTAAISAEATTRATADSALSTRIDSLTATVGDNTSAITSEATARAAADSALGTRVDGIAAQVVIPPMAGSTGDYAGSTTIYAGVWSEQSARAEADLALAQRTDTVSAQIQTTSTTLSAAIQTEATARATADSAQASLITTVQAQADANTAAVQTVANSYADLNGRVAASYQIKTQITANGRTYIAGIGVGVDNSSGTVESQVLVSASRFAVLDPNSATVSSPFVIQGGQVFISQALIGTGWITNLMIGDIIQSTALGANGQPLWVLNKNSGLTFNGANAGQGYAVSDNGGGRAYDNNNQLRVRWGVWT